MNIQKMLLKDGREIKNDKGDFIDFLTERREINTAEATLGTLEYQKKYHSLREAQAYNLRYRLKKRRTTEREETILRSLLRRYRKSDAVLDVPCGGGRLSPVIGEFTHTILEMDLSGGQLLYGRSNCRIDTNQVWMRASAFKIPLKDNSVDGVVCIRLSHHLYSKEEKEVLLAELLRVSKQFVVFYFVDSNAPKYLSRQWRNRLAGSSGEGNSMTVTELREMAERQGGSLTACPASGFLQPHRYALIEKYAGAGG